ncbi:M23 family metallopeptidase [Arcanobacterium hippocoleae]|uniref:M23 family metallopeptidase n=1 Tax=Arcanobacterium hippocoleae TaxID=149017 RepID=UPI00333FF882
MQAEIMAEIAAIDAENRRRAEEAARRKKAGEGGYSDGGGVIITSSDWIQTPLPKPLRITSPFAYRINPVSGRYEFHPAIDIGSQCGTTQRAGAAGTITRFRHASDGNPYGNAVYINHGIVNGASWVTFHAHLSRIDVRIGQHVAKGEPIGLTGTTGWSTGCHLHYEVFRNGKQINPMSLPSFN